MDMREITAEQADEIYTMLVETCGATEHYRQNFIQSATEGGYANKEYRFCGHLGYGGKFRNNYNGVYVDFYPEDRTPEVEAIADEAKAKLAEMGFGRIDRLAVDAGMKM